jgi:hypothetical protein
LELYDDFRGNVPCQHDDLTRSIGDQFLDWSDGDARAGYSAAMLRWRQVDRVREQRRIHVCKGHQYCGLRRRSIPGDGDAATRGGRKLLAEGGGSETTPFGQAGHGGLAVKASTAFGL